MERIKQEELTSQELLAYCRHENSQVRDLAWKKLVAELLSPKGIVNIQDLNLDPTVYNKTEFYKTFLAETWATDYWNYTLILASKEKNVEQRLNLLFSLMSNESFSLSDRMALIVNISDVLKLEADPKKSYAVPLLEFMNKQGCFYEILPLVSSEVPKAPKEYDKFIPELHKLISNLKKDYDLQKYISQAVEIFVKISLTENYSPWAYEKNWDEIMVIIAPHAENLLKDTLQMNWQNNERSNVQKIISGTAFRCLSHKKRVELLSAVLSQPDVKMEKISREPFWNKEMQEFLLTYISDNILHSDFMEGYLYLLKKLIEMKLDRKNDYLFSKEYELLNRIIFYLTQTRDHQYLSENVDLLISIIPRLSSNKVVDLFALGWKIESGVSDPLGTKLIEAIFKHPGNIGTLLRERHINPEIREKIDLPLLYNLLLMDIDQTAFPHLFFVSLLQRLKDEKVVICIMVHDSDLPKKIIDHISYFAISKHMVIKDYEPIIADVYYLFKQVDICAEPTPLNEWLLQLGENRKLEINNILKKLS